MDSMMTAFERAVRESAVKQETPSEQYARQLKMKSRPRDYQRSRVYDAENAVFVGQEGFAATIDLEIEVCQILARRITGRQTVVTKGRGGGWAAPHYGGGRGLIRLGLKARRPWYLIHECSHILVPTGVGHGPEFCATYLRLVHTHLGRAWGEELGRSFVKHQVDF